ncbi:hypothetical protein L1887_10408 [Cichorium endivia]|nr:hypothetical protein L1887_10408 [Cichorium endivia]
MEEEALMEGYNRVMRANPPRWLLGTFWRERKVSLETLPDSNCFYSSEFGIFLHVRLGLILFLSSITRLFTLGIRNI